jgi:hypothetical protein
MSESFTFAGLQFPRTIPEFFRSTYNARKLASGAQRPARMRFAYSAAPRPGSRESGFYLDSDFMPGLRWDWCDEISESSIHHTGWFADVCCDTKIRGIVFRLPRGRGFLAGYGLGRNMTATVDYGTVHDSERDAAFTADSKAENAANRELEYQEAARAAGDARQAQDEAFAASGQVKALKASLRRVKQADRAAIHGAIATLAETARESLERRDNLLSEWRGNATFNQEFDA